MSTRESRRRRLGVETRALGARRPENARVYCKCRPPRLRLAADPELSTHRAYGIPKPAPTPEFMEALGAARVNPTGELPAPVPVSEAAMALAQKDGYPATAADEADMNRQWPQLKGVFLIDRAGIVRWTYIECATEGVAGIGKFPSAHE